MTNRALLCLKCRESGHDVDHCPEVGWANEFAWFFCSLRESVRTISAEEDLCERCHTMDIGALLSRRPPWRKQTDFSNDMDESNDSAALLGRVGSLQLWSNCPLCYSLYVITPQPQSVDQQVYLIPDWTISRVSGELGAVTMERPEKQQYATCLLSFLTPSSISLPTRVVAHRGDALAMIAHGSDRTLAGRIIDSQRINARLILDWVEACSSRHDDHCLPVHSEQLRNIRLIDVEAKKVVKYPSDHCEYVALSYVWGNTVQARFRLGDTVEVLPNTLQDAISLTKSLGKKYIWIDSICIDQSDQEDKMDQIDRMCSIYRGAWITIIALSGHSADAGLSRMSRSTLYPQTICHIEQHTLVGLMPTLSQQIWMSHWGSRAWTLQEGLLSPRCLYISDHQMYFDCSSMQCCESLDESKSWAHLLTPMMNDTQEGFVTWMLRQAGGGALRIPLDWPSRRLEHWGEKLNLYSYRNMSFKEDTIRAFAGVLQHLETIYPQGFFWGLPLEDFDWALTWRSQVPPRRRDDFPTWTWAGWKGPLFFGQPVDVEKTRRIPTPLEIRALQAGELRDIFLCSGTECANNGVGLVIMNDPTAKAWRVQASTEWPQDAQSEFKGHLFITAVCLHFTPDFSRPVTATYTSGQTETFSFRVEGKQCLLRLMSMDRFIPGTWNGEEWIIDQGGQEARDFVLLARDHIQGFILHQLMVITIDKESSIAERETILELLIPMDHLELLQHFKPRKQSILLG